MDIVAIRAELCALAVAPAQQIDPSRSALGGALHSFEQAVRRHASAEAEAALSRRPSTLKATLKSAMALELSRAQVMTELRLLRADSA